MAVVIETTLGDITVDLYLEQRPVTCLNFLKLCKMKYYNFNLFHTIRSGFIAQTGDPTGEGSGGESIFGLLEGPEKRFFSGEKMPKIRHTNAGLLSMVCTDEMMVGSQFFLTLGTDLDSLDAIHCVIGEVTEGHEVLRKLNEAICDDSHRPYQDVRITHTVILEDPFNDPQGFLAPSRSPSPSAERMKGGRIAPDEDIDETQGKSAAEIQEIIEEKEAKARATILEIVGDLPDADIAPPENVLFVCKLNPVTSDEDLEIIFSRFGKIVSCEVIRDKKSGDSLQYAFIEFSDKKSCEDAYFKMDNVLIDDRRIHVDFSQSVSKMRWLGKGRGVQHFDDDDIKNKNVKQKFKTPGNEERTRDRNSNRHHDREKYKSNRFDEEQKEEQDKNHERKREREKDYERRREPQKDHDRRRGIEKDSEKRKGQVKDHERRREQDKSNERQRVQENDYEKRKNKENESRQNSRRKRSRSRSQEIPKSKRDDSRERHHKQSRQNYDNGPNKTDKNYKRNESSSNDKKPKKESHSNYEKSKYKSPPRGSDDPSVKSIKNIDDVDIKKGSRKSERKRSESGDDLIPVNKKRHNNKSEAGDKNKRLKKEKENKNHKHEPRTPSPVNSKNKTKKVKKQKTNSKKDDNKKKRRKDSTSSDTDSSDSSSSSDTSSSSEDDRKKRSKRKRRHSTSSSSDSSSSDSSSSSDTSSDSTSSSSSDEQKKRKNNSKEKVDKKRRKKS